MPVLSQTGLARTWGPPCHGERLQIKMFGGGIATVRASIGDATLALDACLRWYRYPARPGDTGAYNCFAGETLVITSDGWTPIGELAGSTATILSPRGPFGSRAASGAGRWVDAPIRSFGTQRLHRITLGRYGVERVVYATADHRWFVRSPKSRVRSEVTTTGLIPCDDSTTVGHKIVSLRPQSVATRTAPSPIGIMAGLVYGDGAAMEHCGAIALHGAKNLALLRYFPNDLPRSHYEYDTYNEPYVHIRGLPRTWKQRAPSLEEGPSILYGWLAGYFAADGRIGPDGAPVEINSTERWRLEEARVVALSLGIATAPITSRKRDVVLPGGGTRLASELFSLRLDPRSLDSTFFLIDTHRRRFNEHITKSPPDWSVLEVEPTSREEEVFCAVVPGSEAFAIEDFLLTGNCRRKVGASGWSNHSYATAIDINWLTNPYGRRLRTDMPPAMRAAIKAIRTNNGVQVWGWGGDWRGNKDCFVGDTPIITVDGPVPVRGLVGREVEMLSTTTDPRTGVVESQWVKGPVESYGWEGTYEVTLRRRNGRVTLRTTAGHRWPVRTRDGIEFVTTADLAAKMRVPALRYPLAEAIQLDRRSIAAGIVWGDGSVYNRHGGRTPQAKVELCGPKTTLRPWIARWVRYWKDTAHGEAAWGLPASFKSLPDEAADLDVVAGFFAGWFACDGHVSRSVPPSLSTSDPAALTWLRAVAPRLGLTITNVAVQPAGKSGFCSTRDNYQVSFRTVDSRLLLRREHHENLPGDRQWFDWAVESVRRTGLVEEVFCPTLDGRHVVAVDTPTVPLLTGQCMHWEVICAPADIWTGINPKTVPGAAPWPPPPPVPGPAPLPVPAPPEPESEDDMVIFQQNYGKGYAALSSGGYLVYLDSEQLAFWEDRMNVPKEVVIAREWDLVRAVHINGQQVPR